MEVKLNLPNYATKSDLKNATGVITSNFAKKSDLASLKSDVYELDNDKSKNVLRHLDSLESKVCDVLKPIPTDLKKLSDVVYKKVVKKICVWMNCLKKLMPLILVHLIKKNRLWF